MIRLHNVQSYCYTPAANPYLHYGTFLFVKQGGRKDALRALYQTHFPKCFVTICIATRLTV